MTTNIPLNPVTPQPNPTRPGAPTATPARPAAPTPAAAPPRQQGDRNTAPLAGQVVSDAPAPAVDIESTNLDATLFGRIAQGANQLGIITDAVASGNDVAANATDIAANAEDALSLAGRTATPDVSKLSEVATKAGKVLGAAGMLIAIADLGRALNPFDPANAVHALGDFAANLGAFASTMPDGGVGLLGKIGGVGAIIGGVMGTIENIKAMIPSAENPNAKMDLSNCLGAIAGITQTVAGVAMLIPGGQPIAAGFAIAAAGLNLAKLAVDNADYLKEKGGQVVDAVADAGRAVGGAVADGARAVGSGISRGFRWLMGD